MAMNPSQHSPRSSDTLWAWKIDLAGTFLYCGGNSLEVVGYRAEELVGSPAGRVMDIGGFGRRDRSPATPEGPDGWSASVVEGRHRSGAAIWFEVTGRPMRDQNGSVVGLEGFSRRRVIDPRRGPADQVVQSRIEAVLEHELLTIVFQPIVELSGGLVVGVEALSRFSAEPSAPPDRWFADAASVGLGVELELLAVRRALDAAVELPGHLHVSVNASPEACLDSRLADLIRHGPIDLRRVVIELTEHTPVVDYGLLDESLRDLRKQGLRIAVDDAGAGFSSLQHILQLKPALIKLDRQVVANLDIDRGRQALGAAMVSFADHIGAQVIAEGIETAAEFQMATELGMTAVQGFLFGRPTADRREWQRWDTALELPRTVSAPTESGRLPPFPTPGPDDALRRRTERDSSFLYVAADVFDALPDPTVVLDGGGFITATNQAWRAFGVRNGGGPEFSGVGVNYLDVCRRAADVGDRDAKEVLEGLIAVLDGEIDESDREYPCYVAGAVYWYLSRITSLGASRGAIAAHLEITGRRPDLI
jgi:PAS domain S-box-containing protein